MEKQALFVSFGMKKKKKKKKNQKKNDEKQTKRERSQKKFSELMNQLHYTHKCEHISSSNEKNNSIYYSRNSNIFFLLDYSCANIPIS